MQNLQIRELIKSKRLFNYEVAFTIGIDESTLSRWLRTPLSAEREKKILTAVSELMNGNGG